MLRLESCLEGKMEEGLDDSQVACETMKSGLSTSPCRKHRIFILIIFKNIRWRGRRQIQNQMEKIRSIKDQNHRIALGSKISRTQL